MLCGSSTRERRRDGRRCEFFFTVSPRQNFLNKKKRYSRGVSLSTLSRRRLQHLCFWRLPVATQRTTGGFTLQRKAAAASRCRPRSPERVHRRRFCERLQPCRTLAVLSDIEVPPYGAQGTRARVHVVSRCFGDYPRACALWPTPADDAAACCSLLDGQ